MAATAACPVAAPRALALGGSGGGVRHRPALAALAGRSVRLQPVGEGCSGGRRRARLVSARASPPEEPASGPGVQVDTVPSEAEERSAAAHGVGAPEPAETETLGEVLRKRRGSATTPSGEADAEAEFTLDGFNPYLIGRKSRAAFDDAWRKIAGFGGSSSFQASSVDFFDGDTELEAPQAAYTTVLVVGGSGRVGRVVVRKLLLRGYSVKVLSRASQASDAKFPTSVQVVEGDVGDYASVVKAVKGVDKVIYCAAARSEYKPDVLRVEKEGVANFTRALQDQYNNRAAAAAVKSSREKLEVANFRKERPLDGGPPYHERWGLEHVGLPGADSGNKNRDYAAVDLSENRNLSFAGVLYAGSSYAEVTGSVDGSALANTEGLLMRALGDSNTYTCILTTQSGSQYSARFNTKRGYSTIRLPFNTFRPLDINDPPVEGVDLAAMSVKFDANRSLRSSAFRFELDWVKALPKGEETDFMLISRADDLSSAVDEVDAARMQQIVEFKRQGETALRNSGLGYTIVRPGKMLEEPGGYRALVFNQSGRVLNTISCADVADVCVKALHEPAARNKTFEVCHEYTAEDGLEQYELIAHLPSQSGNYLEPALKDLQSMT